MGLENDLKPHNKETYEKVKSILQTNNKTCVIQPTGSGKSYILLKLIEDYAEQGRDIIVIEPRKYIFEQLQKKMKKYELLGENVRFLTYSALGKLNYEKIQEYHSPRLVLVDEMYNAGAPVWGKGLQIMFNIFQDDCKYVGFSATPIRYLDKKRNMAEELFDGCIANELGLADAILNRILPLPRYIAGFYTYENEVNAITHKIQSSRITDEEKKELLGKVAVMKKNLDKSKGVSSIFKKYVDPDKGKFIAFFKNTDHLQQMKPCLEEWFSEAGIKINMYEVHYKNPEKDDQFKAFMEDDKLAVCLSVAMLSEGVHGIDGVILLRDLMSPNLYYQQIGRVFAVDMKTVPIIFDLVANCESLMNCNLKNDLLEAIDKRDKDKVNEKAYISDEQGKDELKSFNGCDRKEVTKEDIKNFFIFDQVIDAINAFKNIEKMLISKKNPEDKGYDNWNVEDKKILIEYFPMIGIKVNELFSKRKSSQSIIAKAYSLGLIENEWTDGKIEILKDNFSVYGAFGMKKKFFPKISITKIKKKADELGLVYKGNRWDNKSKIFLIENYKNLSDQQLVEKLNRTKASIHGMAHKLNLRRRTS